MLTMLSEREERQVRRLIAEVEAAAEEAALDQDQEVDVVWHDVAEAYLTYDVGGYSREVRREAGRTLGFGGAYL